MRRCLYTIDGADPLDEPGKRGAERAERPETPCKIPARLIPKRYQSSLGQDAAIGLRRSARRKLAETGGNPLQTTPLEKVSAVLLSQPKGAPQEPIGVTLAEIAEIVT